MQITIKELAQALNARAWGDQAMRIHGAAEPGQGQPGQIALAMSPKYAEALTPGSAAILSEGMDPEAYGLAAAIFAPRPRLVMAGLTRSFDPGPDIAPGIHASAVIDPSAVIGEGAAIGPFVVIGAGAAIGARARIAMEIGSREALREAVIRGLGIATVSQSEYVPDERLHPLPISGAPVLTHIYACCLRERRRSRLVAAFFETVFKRRAGIPPEAIAMVQPGSP